MNSYSIDNLTFGAAFNTLDAKLGEPVNASRRHAAAVVKANGHKQAIGARVNGNGARNGGAR
jgi:hypothetical protein